MILEKSVHSPIDRKRDGLRVLATRFWGRGLRATRYDVWMANLAPSEQLLAAFRNEKLTWREFCSRYKAELWESSSGDKRNATIKNHGQKFTLRLMQRLARTQNVTLLCHCDEGQSHCHRRVLRSMLNAKI